jgi:purine-cytosine permease-like protein
MSGMSDTAGRIEVRGIDHIPDAERHGRPRELFWVWLAANITYLYFLLGGAMLLLGLTVWQSVAVIVAGNLWWLGVGALAITGPASGTPGVVVTRAMFGPRANRPLSAGVGWLVSVAYIAVNLALSALAGLALLSTSGVPNSTAVEVGVLVAVGAGTVVISVYGHATIVRLSSWFTAALAAAMVLLGAFVAARADYSWAPTAPLGGGKLWVALFVGFTIIASGPLSWQTGADYARYLPRTTSRRAVLGWTAAGGLVPSVALGVLGVLAGTRIDMNDPQTSIAQIVPAWFYPVFLLVVVVGFVTNNVLTTYSSGLCLQALGVPARRVTTVVINFVLGGAIAAYALLGSETFLATLNAILQLTVAFLGPAMAIYIVDIVLRRGRYDGIGLNDETPRGPYWYRNGVNVPGVIADVAGTVLAALCLSTSTWTGPIAGALDGADLSSVVGPLSAGLLYLLLWPRRRANGL